jgi:hypothetical protein
MSACGRHRWDRCRSAPAIDPSVVRGIKSLGADPRPDPICGRPPPHKGLSTGFDLIACVHMSGLLSRSHMNAGQDGFRDASSKHAGDLCGQWGPRSISRLGSIDHTICLSPCKFRHRLSTVAVKLLPVAG